NVDAMPLDHLPEPIGRRLVWRAFIHYYGRAVLKRAVHDVAMACHPTDIRGAPVDVVVFQIKYPSGGDVSTDRIAARRVYDAFGFAGAARCVQDEQRVLGIVRFDGTLVARDRGKLMPPVISAPLHRYRCSCSLIDDHRLDRWARGEGFVHGCF